MSIQSTDRQIHCTQLRNAGDWNGAEAVRAYRDGDEAKYARLILQADRLWRQAAAAS